MSDRKLSYHELRKLKIIWRTLNYNFGFYHPQFPLQEKWKTFEGFIEDMGESYFDKATLIRINSNEPHNKQNCRWSENKSEKRERLSLTVGGETMTIAEWATIKQIPTAVLYARLGRGWDDEAVLLTPYRVKKRGLKDSVTSSSENSRL